MKLEIKDFRGIKEGSLELGKFNVILGANNSAKTTVLESIYLMQNPASITIYQTYPLGVINRLHDLLRSFDCSQQLNFNGLFHNYVEEEASISLDGKIIMLINAGGALNICYHDPNTDLSHLAGAQECSKDGKKYPGILTAIYNINNIITQINTIRGTPVTSLLDFPMKKEPLLFIHSAMPSVFNYRVSTGKPAVLTVG